MEEAYTQCEGSREGRQQIKNNQASLTNCSRDHELSGRKLHFSNLITTPCRDGRPIDGSRLVGCSQYRAEEGEIDGGDNHMQISFRRPEHVSVSDRGQKAFARGSAASIYRALSFSQSFAGSLLLLLSRER